MGDVDKLKMADIESVLAGNAVDLGRRPDQNGNDEPEFRRLYRAAERSLVAGCTTIVVAAGTSLLRAIRRSYFDQPVGGRTGRLASSGQSISVTTLWPEVCPDRTARNGEISGPFQPGIDAEEFAHPFDAAPIFG